MKWVIIVFTTILGISRMGLDPTGGTFILDVAKYAVMGGALALAIAFRLGRQGLGSRSAGALQARRNKRVQNKQEGGAAQNRVAPFLCVVVH